MNKPELDILTSPEGQRMLSYVTEGFYDRSYFGLWLYQVMGLEFDELKKWTNELKNEAFPQSSVWALPYWEFAYGIPTNKNLSEEQRRRKLISKIMERAPLNPERIRSLIETRFDVVVDVYENIAPYTFSVVLQPEDKDFKYSEIYRYARSIKPSHLSILLKAIWHIWANNKNRLSFDTLNIHASFFNGINGHIVLLDGRGKLNGEWLLNQVIHGLVMNSLTFCIRVNQQNPENKMSIEYKPSLRANTYKNSLYLNTALNLHNIFESAINNLNFCIRVNQQKPENEMSIEYKPFLRANTQKNNLHVFSNAFNLQNIFSFQQQINYLVNTRQSYKLSGSIIADTMYTLDGSVAMDGSRRLNADTIKEVI